jgi:hypothetical protein
MLELFFQVQTLCLPAHHPKLDWSFTSSPHNFVIIHTSTQFWQANIGFSSSLATKPYKNNAVLKCMFYSYSASFNFGLFWTAIMPIHFDRGENLWC